MSIISLLSLYHFLAIIYQSPLWSINLLAIYHLSISLIYLYHLSYINLLSIYRSSKMENRGDRKMGPNQEVQHKQMWFQRETAKTKTKNKKTLREKNIMRIPQKWRTWERECAPSWTDGLLTKVELWKTLYISSSIWQDGDCIENKAIRGLSRTIWSPDRDNARKGLRTLLVCHLFIITHPGWYGCAPKEVMGGEETRSRLWQKWINRNSNWNEWYCRSHDSKWSLIPKQF